MVGVEASSLRAFEEMAFYDRHGCSRAEWARRELERGLVAHAP
jgi:hypothetical protein